MPTVKQHCTYLRSMGTNRSSTTQNFKVTKVSMAEFPALNRQIVSYPILQYPASFVNPVHTHPRTLEVGFNGTTNKIFSQILQIEDIFVFPKGLVHYQYNPFKRNKTVKNILEN
ncbi:hypothetical protein R3W88_033454 [Solanum pinnatisectum]|uniref:Cupin type-1 domain-containing protein n=1 Tax=Solanum pinnatisectum TaxID=50273 RepID=A0AAV9K183_9SOLN|nr:hypothetical protein R3W88_033454 [Solanum pinnatisectum]